MTKKNPVYLTVILVALAIVLTFQITFLAVEGYKPSSDNATDTQSPSESVISKETLNKIKEIAEYYAALYPGEINAETVEKYLINALIEGIGDDHGVYFDNDAFSATLEGIEGTYKGIGITASYNAEQGYINVSSVMPGSPAEQAGILSGDVITHIGEGESRVAVGDVGYESAVSLIRGERGSYVTLTIVRGEESFDLSVMRDDIINQTVDFHMYSLDARIAVIRISRFEKTTVAQFEDALAKAKEQGAEAYVFDVRSNPGGELNTVTKILDMLLPEGPIIRIEFKDEQKNSQINSDAQLLDAPMTVLCNSSTASAGELFTAALKDYKAATVIGETTYGKGTMQSYVPLTGGDGLAITIAYYLPPFSENYHGVGVVPDIALSLSEDIEGTLTDENDNQLQAAAAELALKLQ